MIKTVLIGLLVFALLWCAVIVLVQRWIMFPRWIIPASPAITAPLGVEVLWQETEQGPVEAWFLAAPGVEEAAPMVVFAHGNGEWIDHWPDMLSRYHEAGMHVLLPEYRGYGRSAGSPSQARITRDILNWIEQLSERPEVDGERLIYHGRSLGGGVVASVAAQRPPAAIILQSTFRSVGVLTRRMGVPGFLIRDPFPVEAVLARLNVPVLLIHGTRDEVIPVHHALHMHEHLDNTTLVLFDMSHNDLPPDRDFWAAVFAFLEEAGLYQPNSVAPDSP